MADSISRLRESDAEIGDAVRAVRAHAEALPPIEDAEAFGAPFDRFADAKVVLLGEATHGTSEFYRARAAITRRLIERHGFSIVAVEADWPDAARIDAYVRHRPIEDHGETFARFPTWMWLNDEVADFTNWLRAHNRDLPEERRAEFRGLDVYSLNASIREVLRYLGDADPEAARAARDRFACLSPWQSDPARYGRAVATGRKKPCDEALLRQLNELLERRMELVRATGREPFFDAVQNARIVHAAEHYYRIMYEGSTESWNLRDRHMFDTLQNLFRHRGDGAKAVVWAHNSHIGNAAATAMGWQGEFNIGELCRTAYRDDAVLIGFGTDRGTVAAASDWDEPMEIKQVRPARPDSHERVFRDAGLPCSLTDWREDSRRDLRDALAPPRLERAIGVVYRPETELYSHYFQAILAEQFDAFVWFEETRAVTPLTHARGEGVLETFPFGL
jgi:erythromycin esterase-like protein